jgi:hypothetical protein
MNGLIAFLTENCCKGLGDDVCIPAGSKPPRKVRKKERVS